jgi:hypothetical protein
MRDTSLISSLYAIRFTSGAINKPIGGHLLAKKCRAARQLERGSPQARISGSYFMNCDKA